MWQLVGKALVAAGVAIAGGKKYNGKKNPNWSNIHSDTAPYRRSQDFGRRVVSRCPRGYDLPVRIYSRGVL